MAEALDKIGLGVLLDFYGPMLTEHRREIAGMYCEEDMTLSEIADALSITRQGVSDSLNKTRRQLEDYEQRLGLAARYRAIRREARKCLDLLNGTGLTNPDTAEAVRRSLENIIEIER